MSASGVSTGRARRALAAGTLQPRALFWLDSEAAVVTRSTRGIDRCTAVVRALSAIIVDLAAPSSPVLQVGAASPDDLAEHEARPGQTINYLDASFEERKSMISTKSPGTSTPFRLDGRIAVVTGAARGIGRAASVALAAAGADVAGLDIAAQASAAFEVAPATPEELAETGRLVEAHGRRFLALTADQRDIGALRSAAEQTVAALGGIDILFANAGIQGFSPLLEMEDAHWHVQIDVNLTGTANAIRAFAPAIVDRAKAHGQGRIIVTSSTQGQHGTLNGTAYSASKWGIIGLMKSAALELGRYRVTVNAVIPGLIDTPLTRHEERYAQAIQVGGKAPSGDAAADEATAKVALSAKSPLGVPWIDPADIAPLVVFLASDEACMVSGTSLAATAGDSANVTA